MRRLVFFARIGPESTKQIVGAISAIEQIVISTSQELIVVEFTKQAFKTTASVENVVTPPTEEKIIVFTTNQQIITGATK